MSKKNTIIVVACPDRGVGNDPEALGLAFHQGPTFIVKLLQTWLMKTEDYQTNLCLLSDNLTSLDKARIIEK